MAYKKKDLKDVIVVIVVIANIRAPRNHTLFANGNNLQNNDNNNNNNNINSYNNNNSIFLDKNKDLKQLFCNRTRKTFFFADNNIKPSDLIISCDSNDLVINIILDIGCKIPYMVSNTTYIGGRPSIFAIIRNNYGLEYLLIFRDNMFSKRPLQIEHLGQEGSR